jgi:type I restriction enzyme, R subunit
MALSEADTRAKLIDPKLYQKGWTEEHIKREETAGTILVIDGKGRRRRGTTDYTLRIKVSADAQPVAVAIIEAKKDTAKPDDGLEQAKLYGAAKRLNVQFVYSTNGHQFVEFNRVTQKTSEARPLEEFPTPEELQAKYEARLGFSLESEAAKPLLEPYYNGEASRRYYQDAAIRAVLEKLAQGESRALLSLATGAGKTFIAVNLLRKIWDAGNAKKALFICDRDELRTQAGVAFQKAFGNNAAEVSSGNPQKNAKVLIATYQTLDVDSEIAEANFLTQNYPKDYFTHIIIDECHRSAWGKWKQVFERNPNAVQVGLTATPRKIKVNEHTAETEADERITADNYKHFGEPVYEYDLTQGIEDGYLAALEIISRDILINSKKEIEVRTGVDQADLSRAVLTDARTGKPLSPAEIRQHYEAASFERELMLPDRVKALSQDLFNQLLEHGGTPEQKTIIFCASDQHAQAIANELGNLYSDWCRANGREIKNDYAFKCTAASSGNDFLPDFRGSQTSRFIATTVELLTTGVDVPNVRNIVFFRYLKSPILLYQMLGRGTRLDDGKLMFRVYDYTDATRLLGEEFLTTLRKTKEKEIEAGEDDDFEGGDDEPPRVMPQAANIGFTVQDAGHYVLMNVGGKHQKVSVEEYKQRIAEQLLKEAATIDKFRAVWIHPAERQDLINHLVAAGVSPIQIQNVGDMIDYDLYDVLAEIAYGINPRRRQERVYAFTYKHEDWLLSMPPETRETIKAIVEPFAVGGTEELENPAVLQMPNVQKAGGMRALQATGKKPFEVLQEAKERLFAA